MIKYDISFELTRVVHTFGRGIEIYLVVYPVSNRANLVHFKVDPRVLNCFNVWFSSVF